jgi:hypothetical protein
MNKSESIKELASALALAQGEMKAAFMGSVNPYFKSKYASLGDVIDAAKPTLAKNGLSVSQLVTSEQGCIGVTTILMHKSGEWLSSNISLQLNDEKGRSLAKAAGSVITYLRRYALSAILGMYADEDTDGNEHDPKPKPQAQSKPPEQAKEKTPAQVWGEFINSAKPSQDDIMLALGTMKPSEWMAKQGLTIDDAIAAVKKVMPIFTIGE